MKNFLYLLAFLCLASCNVLKSSKSSAPHTEYVKIETDSGTMIAKLYNQTPLTTKNFVKLVRKHFYDRLLFHRVEKQFMIQGGDPDSRNAKPGQPLGNGGLKYTIPSELDSSIFHQKGALGMARETDDVNPKKASSSCQFYIVEGRIFTDAEMDRIEEHFHIKIPESHREIYKTIGGAPFLDMNYTVFGQVISGLDVIDKIANAPKDRKDRPLHDIKMTITLLKKNEYRKYL
ncbi:MAG TPA: peptidylprolyl isomerase [Hanamia sp.]